MASFRPHDWGSFFNTIKKKNYLKLIKVFVPMIGDLFLIFNAKASEDRPPKMFSSP